MIFSLTLLLGYLSSNLRTQLDEMESTSKEADQSKPDSTRDITITAHKSSRIPAFIRDKLAYFKVGSALSTCRRHLREAEARVITLAEQCKSLRQEVESTTTKREEMTRAFEAKLADLAAAHTAQETAMKGSRYTMQENMDSILKDHINLNDVKEKIAKQLKMAEAKLKLQENTNDTLSGKLHLAEQKRNDMQKKLEVLEAKYAKCEAQYKKQEATFGAKLADQEALFEAKNSEQKAMFDTEYNEQQTMFDNKYMARKTTFDAKYTEQQAIFDTKCKQQKTTFDASYKAQGALFHTKCSEQKAMFDKKVKQQEATFTARLQNERRKSASLEEQREALIKRLGNTETALLKSRQVKVNQEYEFTDAVNSLVPRDELIIMQEECQLYKKIMSVLAAVVLVLMAVVFVGSRFLFY